MSAAQQKLQFRLLPNSISPHAAPLMNSKFCWECGDLHQQADMAEHQPVKGLTVWLCHNCTAE